MKIIILLAGLVALASCMPATEQNLTQVNQKEDTISIGDLLNAIKFPGINNGIFWGKKLV